jgi:hypothetical protein
VALSENLDTKGYTYFLPAYHCMTLRECGVDAEYSTRALLVSDGVMKPNCAVACRKARCYNRLDAAATGAASCVKAATV